jgi:hypothetical protein
MLAAEEPAGAQGYANWVKSCLDETEKSLPELSLSADWAAARYVTDGYELGLCGDPGLVGEIHGRSGGPMRLATDNPRDELSLAKPELKCVVLLFLRDENFEALVSRAREFNKQGNKPVIAIGRRELLDRVKAAGVQLDAALDNHAAPHGGLIPVVPASLPAGTEAGTTPAGRDAGATQTAWKVPTDPVASMIVGWTWIGEFVGACTRLGKMPPMYLGYAVAGGKERAAKIGNIKFHAEKPVRMHAGVIGKRFLAEQRKNFDAILNAEGDKIQRVGEMAAQARKAGKGLYNAVFGHAVMGHVPYKPDDPNLFKRVSRGWFEIDKSVQFAAGDVVFCVGFDSPFTEKEWNGFPDMARQAGAKIVWTFSACKPEELKAKPDDEILIDQHWAAGDAVAGVDGYDVKILPTSGVLSESVYWMVNAEIMRLEEALGAK